MTLRKIQKSEFTPISLAEKFCETMMATFTPQTLHPTGGWTYHQGIFLLGMEKIFLKTGKQKYADYIKAYVDNNVDENGHIECRQSFDDAMAGVLLYRIYAETGEEKYKKALDNFISWIPGWHKTPSGGFWHKLIRPNQMWLDGLFMAQPLCTRYARTFGGRTDLYDMAYTQFSLMRKYTLDEKTHLWHHAYDESREIDWCDKVTGKSPHFWGRAMGWVGAALLDVLEYMPEDYEHRQFFIDTLVDYVEAVVRVQDEETGLWFQVLDRGDDPNNWIETSCSCLFMYTLAKGMRMGLLDAKYVENLQKAYDGLFRQLTTDDEGKIYINDICIGTGVGDYQFYLNRPRVVNDLHGGGAFLLALSEASAYVK